ncbi:MAG: hypothetical protein AB8H12_02385, partial [Lewinella sp.]
SGYRTFSGEYLPTFWPARVPNDVLTEEDYNELQKSGQDPVAQLDYFNPARRKKWLRGYIFKNDGSPLYSGSIQSRIKGVEKFVAEWGKIGILTKKEIPSPPPYLPKEVWVETGRSIDDPIPLPGGSDEADNSKQTANHLPEWMTMNPRYFR